MTPRQQKFFAALPCSWKKPLEKICESPEIDHLLQFLQERENSGAIIYPQKQHIFAALKSTDFNSTCVVIVGQDPYHGPGQAHGLSFSVPAGVAQPPSLQNIFKELHSDTGIAIPKTGSLTTWAQQGVLLLNSILTVEQSSPASHADKGWELFTDAIIKELLLHKRPMVFLLWGAYAQKKVDPLAAYIDSSYHLILKAAHPSPFSVKGFLGCRHFSQTNTFLKQHNLAEINWQI